MTNLIVHIGDGRCGSSAIQAALFDAQAALRDAGIGYYSHHRTSGNFCLGTLVGKSTRGNDAQQRKYALKAIDELKIISKSVDYIVISSESFLSIEPNDIIELLKSIDPAPRQVDVISYVRDPLGMYLSLAQQSIKASYRFPRPDRYIRPIDRYLASWQCHPEVNSLNVRMFDRKHLVEGNAVADFELLLRDLTGKVEIELEHINENTSLSSEQMVVLQDYRSRFCREIEGKSAAGSSRLIEMFTAMNASGLVGSKPALNERAAQLVLKGNDDIISRINHRYRLSINCPKSIEVPSSDTDWSKISSILTPIETDYLHHLKMFIPDFNPSLRRGDFSRVDRSKDKLREMQPGKMYAIERAAEVYWIAESISGLLAPYSAVR